jgi:hypothetical protein
MAAPPYPLLKEYGTFPGKVREALATGVAKREKALKSMRNTKGVGSDSILGVLAVDLSRIGFGTEPRGFAVGPKEFEVDRFNPELGIGLEVEKGRVMLGHQLHLDLLKFHMIDQIRYGVVILPELSREEAEEPFRVACVLLDALYSRPELKLNFDGVLLVGY